MQRHKMGSGHKCRQNHAELWLSGHASATARHNRCEASPQMLNHPHGLRLCLFLLADSQRKGFRSVAFRVRIESQDNQRKILLFTNRWRENPDNSDLPERKIFKPGQIFRPQRCQIYATHHHFLFDHKEQTQRQEKAFRIQKYVPFKSVTPVKTASKCHFMM